MSRFAPLRLLLPAVALLFAGCGTMINLAPGQKCVTFREAPRIYGGVRADLVIAAASLMDLPYSFIGDTVTLPVTVPVAFDRLRSDLNKKSDEPMSQNDEQAKTAPTER